MSLFTKLTTKAQGALYERRAVDFLKSNDIHIIETNWFGRHGEIDIIARQAQKLIFVEVRYRQHNQFGNAASTVNKTKQDKIIKTAHTYMKKQNLNLQHTHYRFDIIAFDGANQTPSWIQNAF